MEKENSVVLFEQQTLAVFEQMRNLNAQKKVLENQEKEVKAALEKACEEFGIKSYKNDIVTISYVEASESTSIDLKSLQDKEPQLYDELMNDYPKVTKRKGYISFRFK